MLRLRNVSRTVMIAAAPADNPTLAEFLGQTYRMARPNCSDGQADQIGYAITAIERWHGGTLRVADLSEPLLRGFLAAYSRTVSPATANSKRGHLLALWQCAWEEGLLAEPPRRAKVQRITEPQRVPEAWTPAEMARILAACDGTDRSAWWRSILLTAYDTGERRGALLAVSPADVDCDHQWIVFRATKTKRQRWAQLSQQAADAVAAILNPTSDRVWLWHGHLRECDRELSRILERAGVRYGRDAGGVWHKFRRTSGTLVEQAGGDGARHLGNSRAVFERCYRDPRFFHSSVDLLPRPTF